MSYLYDRMNRRRSEAQITPTREEEIPTVDDYNDLLQSYRNLNSRYDQQSAELKARLGEIAIKDEALERQMGDIRQMEAELLFLRAALQHAEMVESPEDPSWQQRYESLQVEIEQMRKRWEVRLSNEVLEARHRILLDMLPVADHLDLALQYLQTFNNEQAVAFIGNLETVRRAFMETLRRYGVEQQDTLGKPFDPRMHEAIGTVKQASVPFDHIAQVVQTGYAEGDKILRPARVLIHSNE